MTVWLWRERPMGVEVRSFSDGRVDHRIHLAEDRWQQDGSGKSLCGRLLVDVGTTRANQPDCGECLTRARRVPA